MREALRKDILAAGSSGALAIARQAGTFGALPHRYSRYSTERSQRLRHEHIAGPSRVGVLGPPGEASALGSRVHARGQDAQPLGSLRRGAVVAVCLSLGTSLLCLS